MNPIRVFYSELSHRFYASGHYKQKGQVTIITGQKFDVTDDIGQAVEKYDLEFTKIKQKSKPLCKMLLIFGFCLLPFNFVHAHPGGLDKDGCHTVAKNYTYKDGKVLKAGTKHCHRGIGKMKLDGKEVLEDPPAKEQKAKK